MLVGTKLIFLTGVLIAVMLAFRLSFIILEFSFIVFLIALGILHPTLATLAMVLVRENSGSASAVFGFTSFLMGGITYPLTGVGDMLYSTGIIIVICSLCIMYCVQRALKEPIYDKQQLNYLK